MFLNRKYLFPLAILSLVGFASCGKKIVNFNPVEMTRGEIIAYFQNLLQSKFSSFDKINEDIYVGDGNVAEDFYFNIDNLLPRPLYVKYLLKTKTITDKVDGRGISLLPEYQSHLNDFCNPITIFNHSMKDILANWDGDRTMIFNHLDYWLTQNQHSGPRDQCNRFKGLSCQYFISTNAEVDQGMMREPSENTTCQCAGNSMNVGYFKQKFSPNMTRYQTKMYPDGCYVRPWKPCNHMSFDATFRSLYPEWHSKFDTRRSVLAQMMFPVARIHRCKEGTYCMDMIPGMKKPVCWCSEDSRDPQCVQNRKQTNPKKVMPVGHEFATIRKSFVSLFIPVNYTSAYCNPQMNALTEKLFQFAGLDPTTNVAMAAMKELVFNLTNTSPDTVKQFRLCDFRQGLFCDKDLHICREKLSCAKKGRVDLGRGVCAVNNGFICQSNEECVEKANCLNMKGTLDSYCICESGYGDRCSLENPAFFSKLFHPAVSGFVGNEFIKMQVNISGTLDQWEDIMRQNFEQPCDFLADSVSMKVVNFFQNLQKFNKEQGIQILSMVTHLVNDGPKLCRYDKFLKCNHDTKRCIPMIGTKILKKSQEGKIFVEVDVEDKCDKKSLPKIFQDRVVLSCPPGYVCKSSFSDSSCKPDCDHPKAPRDQCVNLNKKLTKRLENLAEKDKVNEIVARVEPPSSSTLKPTTMIVTTPKPTTMSVTTPKPTTMSVTTPKPTTMNVTTPSPTTNAMMNATTNAAITEQPPMPEGTTIPGPIITMPPQPTMGKVSYNGTCVAASEKMEEQCDDGHFLTCIDGICLCLETLAYYKDRCIIPVGKRCDKAHLKLPDNNIKDDELPKCKYGLPCKEEVEGLHICRPQSEHGLIFQKYEKDERMGNDGRRSRHHHHG